MRKLNELSEEEYLAIEEAVADNARGRAFLRMRDQRARMIAADEVQRMLATLTDEFKKTPATDAEGVTHIRILRQELQEMSAYIQQTRKEISVLCPADTGSSRIMAATGELDAIVSATERATSDILNAAEQISSVMGRMPRDETNTPLCEEIERQTTEILTACSFQDITGQRTTKVVNTLRYIEKRLSSMLDIWAAGAMGPVPDKGLTDERPDAHLLNGPSSEGVSQDDVDALLAGLKTVDLGAEEKPAAKPAKANGKASAAGTAKKVPAPAAGEGPAMMAGGTSINQRDIDALFD
jgi:chemotaxis regulatin CheY-phosphate phosphatase CheZ